MPNHLSAEEKEYIKKIRAEFNAKRMVELEPQLKAEAERLANIEKAKLLEEACIKKMNASNASHQKSILLKPFIGTLAGYNNSRKFKKYNDQEN